MASSRKASVPANFRDRRRFRVVDEATVLYGGGRNSWTGQIVTSAAFGNELSQEEAEWIAQVLQEAKRDPDPRLDRASHSTSEGS